MKTAIAITMIVMGSLLIMTPAVSDYLYQRNIVTIMQQEGANSVTLTGQMTDSYRFKCWSAGSGMIAIAAFCSVFLREPAMRNQHEFAAGERGR